MVTAFSSSDMGRIRAMLSFVTSPGRHTSSLSHVTDFAGPSRSTLPSGSRWSEGTAELPETRKADGHGRNRAHPEL